MSCQALKDQVYLMQSHLLLTEGRTKVLCTMVCLGLIKWVWSPQWLPEGLKVVCSSAGPLLASHRPCACVGSDLSAALSSLQGQTKDDAFTAALQAEGQILYRRKNPQAASSLSGNQCYLKDRQILPLHLPEMPCPLVW